MRRSVRSSGPGDRGEEWGIRFPDRARLCVGRGRCRDGCPRAAAMYDAGQACGTEANMAKIAGVGSELGQAADMCVQTHGGFAFAEEYRCGAQIPRDPALPGRADLDEPDPVGTCATHRPRPLPKSFLMAGFARGPAGRIAGTGGRRAPLCSCPPRRRRRAGDRDRARRGRLRRAAMTRGGQRRKRLFRPARHGKG